MNKQMKSDQNLSEKATLQIKNISEYLFYILNIIH